MTDRAGVEAALDGWRRRCYREGSIAWIRRRARLLPQRSQPAPTASTSGWTRGLIGRLSTM